MLNEPPQKQERPVHPLERRPSPQPKPTSDSSSQRGTLHISVVKPHVTNALIAINTAIAVIMFLALSDRQSFEWYQFGANNRLNVLLDGEYHRLFTAMFLHADFGHLTFNMLALYFIGQTVERFFGHARFLIIYLLGGVLGSLLSVLLNGPEIVSVGASGAVFAIIGGELIFNYNHRKLFPEMAQHRLRQLIIMILINFGYGFALTINSAGVRLDNWGHIGGLIGGVILSYLISPIYLLQRRGDSSTEFEAVDMQPLEQRVNQVVLYASALIILLILGVLQERGL